MKVHVAISVSDLSASIEQYTTFLGTAPDLVLDDYALWRTDVLNLSLRVASEQPGTIRHVGFEDPHAAEFFEFRDRDGVVWERFSASQQAAEIRSVWPEARYAPR